MKRITLSLFFVLCAFLLHAQESFDASETTWDTSNNVWYASPWVWVAGAALVIVLLVVLYKGKETKQ